MTAIDFTRDEILDLMKELPVNHWLQNRLLDGLTVDRLKRPAYIARTVPDVVNPVAETGKRCEWVFYGLQCETVKNVTKNVTGKFFCTEHTGLVCQKCGDPADHGCPEELQFVCGAPLCKHCRICS